MEKYRIRLWTENSSDVSGERFAPGEKTRWLVSNGERWWPYTENDSGYLYMENHSNEL